MRVVLAGMLVVGMLAMPADAAALDDRRVSVYEPGGMSTETIRSVERAALQQGARWAFFHTGTLKLLEVRRGGQAIQQAPSGMAFPMSSVAFEPRQAAPLFSDALITTLASGEIAMGATSAGLRGARAGDVVVLEGWDGRIHELSIGLIADDEEVGYSELILSTATAATMEFERISSASIWHYEDEDHLNVLVRQGTSSLLRVTSPFDEPSVDRVLPSALLKSVLGEFAYRETGRGDWIEIDPEWRSENIVFIDHPLTGPFPCHRVVAPFVETALDQIYADGLGPLVDRTDFQLAGGCFVPRLIRGGDKGGAISRHAYGAAVDINPSDNLYGGVVSMDIRIVRTFRELGFAWGGGWTFTDGMHFEYVRTPEPPDLLD